MGRSTPHPGSIGWSLETNKNKEEIVMSINDVIINNLIEVLTIHVDGEWIDVQVETDKEDDS